jgi:hypothetical protein
VFHRRGLYSVEVLYIHPDPQFHDPLNPRWDTKVFRIGVPGGVDTTETESQSAIQYKVRPYMGGRGVFSDTLEIPTPQMLHPVVPYNPCWGSIEGDTARLRLPAGRILQGEGPVVPDSLGPQQSSIGKGPTSLLTGCGDTMDRALRA